MVYVKVYVRRYPTQTLTIPVPLNTFKNNN